MLPGTSVAVGLISDTHGAYDPAAAGQLQYSSFILHAGDVGHHGGHKEVLQRYAAATGAPLLAVAGNVDDKLDAAEQQLLPGHRLAQLAGWKVLLVHIVASGPGSKVDPAAAALILELQPDIVVFGHSHKAGCWQKDGVCYINPGSAGPARFKLPRTVARLHLPHKMPPGNSSTAADSSNSAASPPLAPDSQPLTGLVMPTPGCCAPRPGNIGTHSSSEEPGDSAIVDSSAARASSNPQRQGPQHGRMRAQQGHGQHSWPGSQAATQAGVVPCTDAASSAGNAAKSALQQDATEAVGECPCSQLGELRVEFVQLPAKAPPRLVATK